MAETHGIEVPEYEQVRLTGIDEVVADPALFKERLTTRLRSCIAQAPTFSINEEVNLNPHAEIAHSFVFKYPEDAHNIPIVEPILFEAFSDLDLELKDQNEGVSEYTLMLLDPRISNLSVPVDDGRTVHGETYLTHEMKHAKAAQEAGHGSVYIVMPLVWMQNDQGRKELKFIHASSKIIPFRSAKKMVAISLAPEYPSHEDFLIVSRSIQGHSLSFHLKIEKYLMTLPYYEQKIVNGEVMQQLIKPVWESERAKTPAPQVV